MSERQRNAAWRAGSSLAPSASRFPKRRPLNIYAFQGKYGQYSARFGGGKGRDNGEPRLVRTAKKVKVVAGAEVGY